MSWQLPEHRVHEFFPKRTRFCLCIPVLDENGRFSRQLAKMSGAIELADVVIADGGSSDGSTDEDRLRAAGVRALLVKTGAGRLGAQLGMAFAWALDQGYDGVVLVDGNDKDDTSALPLFLDELSRGADFVQGSRYVAGGEGVNTPFWRELGVRLLHAPAISIAARFIYTDTTNGFRAYSARFLRDERVAPFRDVFSGYELHYYLSIRAARLGFKVVEVPVRREYPRGHLPSKIRGLRGGAGVLQALAAACLGRFDP
ncbi:MAG TPA: glycosyltransferase family 2 protein [Myxococcales bacterium]|nr:glycosyltransferase family 2 protein [Myxococcales bacterium]